MGDREFWAGASDRGMNTDRRDTLVIVSLHARDAGGISEGSLGPARQYKFSFRGCVF